MKKAILSKGIAIICILYFSIPLGRVYGSQNKLSGLYLMQKLHQEDETEGKAFLLFCDAEIAGEHKGNLYIVRGNVTITGNVQGNIYSYEGHITLGKGAQVIGGVYTILGSVQEASKITVTKDIHSLIPSFPLLLKILPLPQVIRETIELPRILVRLIHILLQLIVGFLIIFCSKDFVEQGNMILYNQHRQVIRDGGILWVMFAMITGLFALSLIGFPIAILFLLVIWLLTLIGEIIIGIYIGWQLEKRFSVQWSTYIHYLFGASILEIVKAIPIMGWVFIIIILPWISLGILGRSYINRKIYNKKFVDLPKEYQQDLYKTITAGVERKKGEEKL